MKDPRDPTKEETVTRVSESPGERQETTYRTAGTVATAGSRLSQLVWLAAGVVAAILALDFVFKLIAAGAVGFVSFIADIAAALAAPFHGVLATTVTSGAHVAYWPNVVAIVVYGLAAWVVVRLVGISTAPRAHHA